MSCPVWYWFSVWLMLTEMKDRGGEFNQALHPPPLHLINVIRPFNPCLSIQSVLLPINSWPPFPSYPHPLWNHLTRPYPPLHLAFSKLSHIDFIALLIQPCEF